MSDHKHYFEHADYHCLRINAPHFWNDPVFAEWAADPDTIQIPNDLDVFTFYEHPEDGWDIHRIPPAIWADITAAVRRQFGTEYRECLVWISCTD